MLALYHNDMSLCAQKVRVCLAEKKLEWESRHLKLRAGDHQQPWYLKLNRRAVVPTLSRVAKADMFADSLGRREAARFGDGFKDEGQVPDRDPFVQKQPERREQRFGRNTVGDHFVQQSAVHLRTRRVGHVREFVEQSPQATQ